MKKLIINADDLGLNECINNGIIDCYKNGILTSATIMANMPVFNHAVELIKQNRGLGVGVHLNITTGKPLNQLSDVSYVIDKNGFFLKNPFLLIRKVWGKKKCLDQIEKEFRAQIKKTLAAGIEVTHLDSHKHIHCYPAIYSVVVKLARDFGIKKIRHINEEISHLFPFRSMLNTVVLNFLSHNNMRNLREFNILHPDFSFGILLCGGLNVYNFEKILKDLKDGTTEIMVHPGFCCEKLRQTSFLIKSREEETRILLSQRIKDTIKQENIKLISYRELN